MCLQAFFGISATLTPADPDLSAVSGSGPILLIGAYLEKKRLQIKSLMFSFFNARP